MYAPAELPSAGLAEALHSFANGNEASGPLSMTAARMQGIPAQSGPAYYAPFNQAAALRTQGQAGRLIKQYDLLIAGRSLDPDWHRRFWNEVHREDAAGGLEAPLRAMMVGQGYIGNTTMTAPRPDIRKRLEELERSGAPAHGAAAAQKIEASFEMTDFMNEEAAQWNACLPTDMQRAAPEIYRSMRAAGATSTRNWISTNYTGSKSAPLWVDLWNSASIVDFRLSSEKTQSSLLQALASDDSLEIHLRRMAAYIYEKRTRDTTGASMMLALKAPGLDVDVAPSWLVSEVTQHSKNEHQRTERVKAEHKAEKGAGGKGAGAGDKGGKGKDGKGKKGKKGGAAGAALPTQG
jgi:hypothetical protein